MSETTDNSTVHAESIGERPWSPRTNTDTICIARRGTVAIRT